MTRIISIEGNIGSGKSTFVKNLELFLSKNPREINSSLSICFLQEPVDIWNQITDENGKTIIENYYSDQKAFAFPFQMMAYISRLHCIKEALKKQYDIIFVERSVYTDRNVFAKMLYDEKSINEIEYKIYNLWFDDFIKDIPAIEFVYINTTPEVANARVIKRARPGEIIPLTYLQKCHDYHDKWLSSITHNKYIIDGNSSMNEEENVIQTWIRGLISYFGLN